MARIRILVVLVGLLLTGGVALASPAAAETVTTTLRSGVAGLPVATEVRTGYSRDLFPHWIDADGDGCNTRYEVLIAEAVTAPSVGAGCTLSGGRWYSYYDNVYWTRPGRPRHRPLRAARRGVGLRRPHLDHDPAPLVRERPG
jgi:hypothetical protein